MDLSVPPSPPSHTIDTGTSDNIGQNGGNTYNGNSGGTYNGNSGADGGNQFGGTSHSGGMDHDGFGHNGGSGHEGSYNVNKDESGSYNGNSHSDDNIIPVVPVTQRTTTPENSEDNNLSPVSGFKMDPNKNKYNVGSGAERPSLNKALVSFLLPCIVIWLGNSLTDWWIL